MRVAIAVASSARHISGVQRHAVNLTRCLLTREEITAVDLIAAPWQHEWLESAIPIEDPRLQLHSAQIGTSAMSRNRWFYEKLPSLSARLQSSILHLAYPAPLNRRALTMQSVVTLHDLYPYDIPDNFGFPKVLINQLILQQCLQAASAIVCVSKSTSLQLARIRPLLARRKSTIIPNSVEAQPNLSLRSPLPGRGGEPFLLCVAQHRRNKNILFLLQVFAHMLLLIETNPATRLVIVGIEGPETNSLRTFTENAAISENVTFLSGLSEEELQWCYRHCEMLLAPSTIEGFGLPVAEALLAGCPVICSDIPAFREVGGAHCRYVALDSVAEQNFLEAILYSRRIPRLGPIALPHLSNRTIAESYIGLYTSLLFRTSTPKLYSLAKAAQNLERRVNDVQGRSTARVLGISVDAMDMSCALDRIANELQDRRKGYICLAGVHGIMEAHRDKRLAAIYAGSTLTLPDGAPTVWVGRWQGFLRMKRVAGPELMLELFRNEKFAHYTHFFYGGREYVAEQLRQGLSKRFPWVRIVGTFTPPFRELNEQEKSSLVACVRELKPDIIWVGISTPKQEYFMHQYINDLDTTLMLGVGAAFDYHTGRIKDAPKWVKRVGMQWLHRLMQDPRRLWRRYLRNNSSFIWHIVLQLSIDSLHLFPLRARWSRRGK